MRLRSPHHLRPSQGVARSRLRISRGWPVTNLSPMERPLHQQLGMTDDELAAVVERARTRAHRSRARDVRRDVVRALLVQVVASAPRALPHERAVGAGRPGRRCRRGRHRRRPRGGRAHREPQPPVGGRAVRRCGHRRGRDHPRHLLDGRAPDRVDGPVAFRQPRRRADALLVRRRRVGDQRLRQFGGRAHGRRGGGVRRHLSRQPARERAVRRHPARVALGARPRRGPGQPRGAVGELDRPRRHRRRERARVGGLRGRRRGQAAVGAGRRPVRGKAPDRGVFGAARPEAGRGGPGSRRGRLVVRGVGDRGQRWGRHGRRPRARREAASPA